MKELTERQQAALNAMKNRLADVRSYPTAEAFAAAWERKYPAAGNAGRYERMCAAIRWEMAQENKVNFTNMFHHTRTIRELADKGYIRIVSEESHDFNLHLFILEILQEEGGSKDE